MTIPTSSNYPTSFDTSNNLYQVHDDLRIKLLEDYNPGDTSIVVPNDPIMQLFSGTGLITLTEQCSDINVRAISFYYSSIGPADSTGATTTFNGLQLLPGFTDTAKPKFYTNVTQNVMADHHNNLKNALINIEEFAGLQGTTAIQPLVGTMEQRVNYLRNLVLGPKAWFSANSTIGLAPLAVEFTDESFRLGTDGTSPFTTWLWDFGDNTGPSIVTINETTTVPTNATNVLVSGVGGTITKTYTKPGIYTVTLTVTNAFGSDTVIFPNIISARFQAPDYAIMNFVQYAGQIVTTGSPPGGPYTTYPKIRSAINTIIDVIIPSGINPNTGETYAGEIVDGSGGAIDPIVDYTWSISDDLTHNNAPTARAAFSVGGIYDLTLRVDTSFGAYRITSYPNSFDIVENYNLWFWTYNSDNSISSSEFGLISETFKTISSTTLSINTNDSFLNGQPNQTQQQKEFNRNVGFSPRGSTTSGLGGVGLLYWASGRNAADSPTVEQILMSEFNGFVGTYVARPSVARPWNWIGLPSSNSLYFVLGGVTTSIAPNTSPTNQILNQMSLSTLAVTSTNLTNANYLNGASELQNNEVVYNISGESEQGNMSVYRSAWSNIANTGYFLRNEGVGNFFRMLSFYGTSGNSAQPFQNIRKLADMAGPAKVEGQLVSLSQGVYFFNNSGSVSAYSPTSGVWTIGGPGANSSSFRLLQDSSVVNFDSSSQTLIATSDGDNVAYLSFDYSPNAFIRFNQTDTTFSAITTRPNKAQWQMSIF